MKINNFWKNTFESIANDASAGKVALVGRLPLISRYRNRVLRIKHMGNTSGFNIYPGLEINPMKILELSKYEQYKQYITISERVHERNANL